MEKTHPLYGAKWIAGSRDCQSPVISRTFSARKPVKAELHITGLGYFDARINGKPVTELRLLPAVSEFGPRDLTKFSYPILDTLSYRIYYCSFDVTGLLEEENLLTVRLGNGWYRQLERRDEGPLSFGDQLKCIYCLTLHYPGGMERILSDGSECWNSGHIVYNDLFIGEVHDFSKPSSPSAPVEVLEDEGVPLCPQIGPGDKIARILQPRKLWVKDGKEIWDAGENISGLVRLTVHGKAGERVVLRFAEERMKSGFEASWNIAGSPE